jgi:hypothetical protein
LVNGKTKRFFLFENSVQCGTQVYQLSPFASLHGRHRSLDIVVIAVNLLFEIFFAFRKMLQGIQHTIHLLLSLQPLAVLAADIASNGIQNALESVVARNLPLFL